MQKEVFGFASDDDSPLHKAATAAVITAAVKQEEKKKSWFGFGSRKSSEKIEIPAKAVPMLSPDKDKVFTRKCRPRFTSFYIIHQIMTN